MKTSLEFTNASPEVRAEMITDGFEHMAMSIRSLHANLLVLNNWIESAPRLMHEGRCNALDLKALGKAAKAVESGHDDLTEELIRHCAMVVKLSQYIKTKQV